ncbi:MAG: hypothetical protein IKR46_02150, partial [Clostridia bacterium]|nr:hypothetical protein [Clostridia bacterium]
DTVWQVLTSFGFCEEDSFSEKSRYFILDKKEAAIVTLATPKARAEAVSACIEAAFAVACDNFSVKVSDNEVFNLLSLFGFENILELDMTESNGFCLISDGTVFAEGTFEEKKTITRLDMDKLFTLCKGQEIGQQVSKSLIFAEKDAEGVAYDICYTLRINGCIVEMYCENGDINAATDYAKSENASAIIRCYPDACVEIKDMVKNEIIKTTVSDFLGYYEDDCDCGHDHHGEDCDCGHHHH